MKRLGLGCVTMGLLLIVVHGTSFASPLQSFTPQTSGGTLIDFEGLAEGTLISTEFGGVTFSQIGGTTYPGLPSSSPSRPQIDNAPQLFGYGFSSGSGALTGSTEGGFFAPTVAGIRADFSSPVSSIEWFFSDTAPLGTYTMSAFDSGGILLESLIIGDSAGEFVPPGYAGGVFPDPGTSPLPGVFVGFSRGSADIAFVVIGPSSASGDAYAIDDFRFSGGEARVPEPDSLVLLGSGLLGLAALIFARRRSQAASE